MGEKEFVASSIEDAVAVGHPRNVVRENIGDTEGAATVDGDDPESLLGFGGEVRADEELQAVGRDVAKGWGGDFAGDGERKGIPIGDGYLGENGAAILDDGREETETVSGGGGQALHIRCAGSYASGMGDLRDAKGSGILTSPSEEDAK